MSRSHNASDNRSVITVFDSGTSTVDPELARKKFTIPEGNNLSVNLDYYIDIERNATGGFNTGAHDFSRDAAPGFHGDSRLKRLHLVLPKADGSVKVLPDQTAATSTFIGGSCGTCRLPTGRQCHSLTDKPICLILGDEFVPVLCGDRGKCCPTLRVQSGTFAQLRSLLEYQMEAGLKLKPGSVAVVMLLSHLLRIGHDDYWTELLSFTSWAATKNLTILPSIPTYPTGLRPSDLMVIGQFVQHLVIASYGAAEASTRKNYEFWRPAVLSLQQHHAEGGNVVIPPTKVHEMGNRRFDSAVNVSQGLKGDWKNSIPPNYELSFIINLIDSLKDLSKKSSKVLSLPSEEDLRSGMQFTPAPAASPNQGKNIILVGHSILSSAKYKLDSLVNPLGVQVLSLCKTGVHYKELFEGHSLDALASTKEGDVLVVSYLGNYLLHQQQVTIDYPNGQKTVHLRKPTIIDSTDFKRLVEHINIALAWLRNHFSGKIVVLNVIPRHTTNCCRDPDHIIVDHGGKPVSMLNYVKAFNELLALTIHLPHNCTLADYQDIFGTEAPQLFDGVHLKRGEQAILADFISTTLNLGESPETPPKGSVLDFHNLLVQKEIISDVRAAPQLPSPFMDTAVNSQPAAPAVPAPQGSAHHPLHGAQAGAPGHSEQEDDPSAYSDVAAIDDAIRLLEERKRALQH